MQHAGGPQPEFRGVRKSNEFVRFFDIPDTPPPPHLPLERFAVLNLKSIAGGARIVGVDLSMNDDGDD